MGKILIRIGLPIIITLACCLSWSNDTFAVSFNPGLIIADSQATNTTSPYTPQQIQSFLDARNPTCAVSVCLKNYKETKTGLTSSQIIAQAAAAYNISPKLLIALLETETLLVTDQSPNSAAFDSAFGIRDTYGFSNQANNAAKLLSDVISHNTPSIYQIGIPTAIPYKLTIPSCGSTQVTIQNVATAALYTYPGLSEQPNAAAISANYSKGDDCSSYGIRNFFLHYDQWFNPTAIDIDPPTTPSNFSAAKSSTNSVLISFNQSTDNLGPVSYVVYKNDKPLTTLPVQTNSFTDHSIPYSGGDFTYYIVARDAAGNTSPPSDKVTVSFTDSRITVYRFYSPVVKRHLYSADPNEVSIIRATMSGIWSYEGASFRVKATSGCGAGSSVYRFYSQTLKTHLYSIDENEKNYISTHFPSELWRYEGVSYCADTTQASGTLPIYRFYSQTLKTHLYTMDQNEKNSIISNFPPELWKYEGIAYYAFPN